jgi:elongation factor 3
MSLRYFVPPTELLQVASAAVKCATSLCTTLANPDLAPHISALVKCMSNPDAAPACIKALSSTTFVAEVTAPALAVLVPLLLRALNDRSMEVQRRTVVVIDNLVKLVRNPVVAARYLSPLVMGVQKIAEGAAFPEVGYTFLIVCFANLILPSIKVRAFGKTALDTLLKAGASTSGTPPTRDVSKEVADVVAVLLSLLPSDLIIPSASGPNAPPSARHPLLGQSLQFQGSMVADLVYNRRFQDPEVWKRCVGVYMTFWLGPVGSASFAESARSHFRAIDQVCTLALF